MLQRMTMISLCRICKKIGRKIYNINNHFNTCLSEISFTELIKVKYNFIQFALKVSASSCERGIFICNLSWKKNKISNLIMKLIEPQH